MILALSCHLVLSLDSLLLSMTYAVVEATRVNSSRGNLLLIWEKRFDQVVQCNDVRLSPVSLKMRSNTSAR